MRGHFEWYAVTKKPLIRNYLVKHKTASKHIRNLQILVTETFKTKIGESLSVKHKFSK